MTLRDVASGNSNQRSFTPFHSVERLGRRQVLRSFFVLCGIGSLGVLGACSGTPSTPAPPQTTGGSSAPAPTSQAPAKGQALAKVRIGLLPLLLWQLPYYLGEEKGIFAKHGVAFDLVISPDDTIALKGIASGDLEAVDFNPISQIVAISKGAEMKILGAVAPTMFLAMGAKKEIKTLRDLYGKSVNASGAGGDLFTRTWQQLFKKEGLDIKQVQFLNTGTSGASVQALIGGKVDAAVFVIELGQTVSADPNLHVLFIVAERLPQMPMSALSVRNQMIQERPDVVQNLVLGTAESVRYVLDHKDEAVEAAVRRAKMDPKVASTGYDSYVKAKIWSEDAAISVETLTFVQEMNKEMGDQDAILPLEKISSLEFQKKAIAQFGPRKR